MSKKKEKKEEIDEIGAMMNSMLDNFDDPKENTVPSESNLPARDVAPPFNVQENRTKSEKQAQKLLKELLKFYLSDNYISENSYINAKIAIDQMSLAGLINQIKLSEAAISRLMESIEGGEIHPRMFEVLAGMQRVYIDLYKMQSLSIIATEEHMKKLKNDYDYYQSEQIPQVVQTSEESTTVRGTRDFLRNIQEEETE